MEPAIVYGRERANLILAGHIASMLSPNGYVYRIGNTYFDDGQDWEWTTLIAHEGNGDTHQALNPREWSEICLAETPEQIVAIVREMFEDKFCPDK